MINIGLCNNRHVMPVSSYIYEEVVNPLDFKALFDIACTWVENNLTLIQYRKNITDCNGLDAYVDAIKSEETVNLYITGLTSCLLATLDAFNRYGVSYHLFHYDRENDAYVEQPIYYI